MGNNYQSLINRLDEFIRKFYLNQLIRGGIYAIGGGIVFFLLVAVLEHFGRFNTGVRTFLFFSLAGFILFILGRYIIYPLTKLMRLGKIITYEQAATIIGQHFSNVQDKLLNVLQLSGNRGTYSGSSQALLEASVEQKISELKPIPFVAAVDLKDNRRYALLAAIPVLTLLLIVLTVPQIITDSTRRIVEYNTYFAPPAPFSFTVLNSSLAVPAREDFTLEIKVDGSTLPEEVFLKTPGGEYRMQKESANLYRYNFKNLSQSFDFNLLAAGISSEKYNVSVIPKPALLGFSLSADYPSYTGITDETFNNQGDIEIPEGTVLNWNFNTDHTSALGLAFSDSTVAASEKSTGVFSYGRKFRKTQDYAVILKNEQLDQPGEVRYRINVKADQHPQIEVEQHQDSLAMKNLYFKGTIRDDYGFSRLVFHVAKTRDGQEISKPLRKDVKFTRNQTSQNFYHTFNFNELKLAPGDQAVYFFEVWDNDGVNGSKMSRTTRMVFKAPSLKELSEKNEEMNQELKNSMKSTIMDAKKIQKELKDLEKKMLEKQQPGWEEKKKLEDLLDRQKNLQKQVESIQQEMQMQMQFMEEFGQPNPELMEKQKMLEELMNQVLTEEMKDLMEKLREMTEKMNKQDMQEALKDMELNSKDVEKELDRTLELMKQLEVEQKAEDIMKQLEELSEEQEELSEKTLDKKEDKNELSKKQEDLNKKFEDLQKQMDELRKKNEELETPLQVGDSEKKEEEINQEMKKSSENLEKNNRKQSSENQKSASEKMDEMKQEMQSSLQSGQEQQQGEDIQALRQLLENLLTLSLDQEKVMEDIKNTDRNSPAYTQLSQVQRKLKDDAAMIGDSLFALSKRVPQIDGIVNREMNEINSNLDRSLEHLQERQVPMAGHRQQLVMTSTNNLALLLSEAVKQMQQQMQQMKSGSAACKKPGSSGKPQPTAAQMRQMQQQINQQIEKMKEQMEKEGGNSKSPRGKGGSQMSEELAKMAAKQQAIRQYLQQLSENMEKEGGGKGSTGNLSKKMEETETDLVNKRITQETIKRQQEILTRLLEAEKAEREREMDPKRQSKEAQDLKPTPSAQRFLEYQRQKEKEAEMLRSVSPRLQPFYKEKVNEYFNNLEK